MTEDILLVDPVSAEQEKDFLLRLGIEASDLQDVLPECLVPSFWPCKSERISVCLNQAAAKDLRAPGCGWYEGEVCSVSPTLKRSPKWINVKWTDPRVNGGRRSWIDACRVLWAPSLRVQPPAEGGAAADAPGAWLRSAAARCALQGRQADPEQASLRRWWSEARRGVARLALTPAPVAAELRELHEARQFMACKLGDARFWRAVNRGASGLAELEMPQGFLAAISEAKQRGARYISPFGIYVAPSQVAPGELGLHTLLLFHPCELVGSWEGEWLWETEKDRFKRSGEVQARPLREFPNAAAIHKYGMHFQNADTIDGQQREVNAMIDSCRGACELSLRQVCERNEPFGFMNEPPAGQTANCEVQSRVNLLEDPAGDNRYSLLVVAMLPLPPHSEILINYGRRYDRSYATGEPCPQLFAALSVQSPSRGDFGALGPPSAGPAETSTAVPSTPLSGASSASDSAPAWPEEEEPVRASARIRERLEREAACRAARPVKRARKGLAGEAPAATRPPARPGALALPAPGDWVYVRLAPAMEVGIPHEGWFEALVVSVGTGEGEAELWWSHDRVGSGQQSRVDLQRTRWAPCVACDAVAPSAHECPLAWLRRAASSVQQGCEEPSARIFFARWWAELRWGFVRFSATPRGVVEQLREMEEVRRFVAAVAEDGAFWRSVTEGSRDLSELPPAVAGAIREARRAGARCFFSQGLFVARSQLDHRRYGLHTLSLLHPAASLGVFDAGNEAEPGTLPQPPRCQRWKARALSDAHSVGQRAALLGIDSKCHSPVAFLGRHPAGCAPNCSALPVPGQPARVVLLTSLPVLPMGELLAPRAGAAGLCGAVGPFAGLALRPVGAP